MLTIVFVMLLAAAGLVRCAPDLPLARFLGHWLAERPARWLLRRSRREFIAWAIVAALFAFAGEYIFVIGGPQAALIFAADLAAYIDAAIAVGALATAARVQMAGRWFGGRPLVRRARARSRRRPGVRPLRPANDADDIPRRWAA